MMEETKQTAWKLVKQKALSVKTLEKASSEDTRVLGQFLGENLTLTTKLQLKCSRSLSPVLMKELPSSRRSFSPRQLRRNSPSPLSSLQTILGNSHQGTRHSSTSSSRDSSPFCSSQLCFEVSESLFLSQIVLYNYIVLGNILYLFNSQVLTVLNGHVKLIEIMLD